MISREHHHLTLASNFLLTATTTWSIFKRYRVGTYSIEEPAIVRDDENAAGKAMDSILETSKGVDVEIIRGFVQ